TRARSTPRRRSRSSRKILGTACSPRASARPSASPRRRSRGCPSSSTSPMGSRRSPTVSWRRRFLSMGSAKRASMREGPLAALFRKTEELEGGAGEEDREKRAKAQAEAQPEQPEQPDAAGEDRERGAPHPSLSAPEDEEAPRVPTPRERLRHAFSSELPDDMLERGTSPLPPRRTPAADALAAKAPGHEAARAQQQSGPAGRPVIRVVGVGGAGVNAVNRMVEAEVEGVEFLTINTDLQSLEQSGAHVTLHIGVELTRGLGSGSDASVGRQAAMEDYDHIKALLKGSDMIFITAGAGGGTGSGAAPIVARIAREVGALTVAIVTKP